MMLVVRELESGYGNLKVLKGVSFSVSANSVTALLGGNGSGKSTTLKVISGLLPVQHGTVEFEEKSLAGVKPHRIVRLGISHVTQGKDVFPSLSVEINLRLGAFVRSDRGGVKRDLDKVTSYFPRLKDRMKQLAGTLSGGEQQMMAIARGLMSRPKLLILDEPSAALAPKIIEEIYSIIEQIHADGTTILLVEQNIRMALTVAKYAYILREGKIVFDDTAENLLKHEDVKSFYLGKSQTQT